MIFYVIFTFSFFYTTYMLINKIKEIKNKMNEIKDKINEFKIKIQELELERQKNNELELEKINELEKYKIKELGIMNKKIQIIYNNIKDLINEDNYKLLILNNNVDNINTINELIYLILSEFNNYNQNNINIILIKIYIIQFIYEYEQKNENNNIQKIIYYYCDRLINEISNSVLIYYRYYNGNDIITNNNNVSFFMRSQNQLSYETYYNSINKFCNKYNLQNSLLPKLELYEFTKINSRTNKIENNSYLDLLNIYKYKKN